MHPASFLRRLLPCLLLGALSACGNSPPPPPPVFKPLNYDYLPPIVLKVANITVQNNYVPDPSAATLIGEDPEPPANAVLHMLRHRLVPDGTPGSATATVEDASLQQTGGQYVGTLTVRVDVASPDNRKTGYIQASVTVNRTAPGGDASQDDVRTALYDVTKRLMVLMNVQLQYQLQHNLGSWISYNANPAAAAAPGPAIQAAPLSAPGSEPANASGATQPAAPQPESPAAGAPQSLTPPASQPGLQEPPTEANGLPLGSRSLGTLPVTPGTGTGAASQ